MNNKSICYIFGAGEYYLPPENPNSEDLVIAADGGYAYLKSIDITPDIVIGDFDSLGYVPCEVKTIALPAEKDVTDTAAAIETGWSKGYRVFCIYGGTGGRIDHTLANIQCVADIAIKGGRAYLIDKDCIITAVHNGEINFKAMSNGYISVFSHSSVSVGVNEKGLKYALSDARLSNSYHLGVSNEFTGERSLISVKDGTLIIIYSKKAKLDSKGDKL